MSIGTVHARRHTYDELQTHQNRLGEVRVERRVLRTEPRHQQFLNAHAQLRVVELARREHEAGVEQSISVATQEHARAAPLVDLRDRHRIRE